MVTGYKRIKILSEAEINDLYSLPKVTFNVNPRMTKPRFLQSRPKRKVC